MFGIIISAIFAAHASNRTGACAKELLNSSDGLHPKYIVRQLLFLGPVLGCARCFEWKICTAIDPSSPRFGTVRGQGVAFANVLQPVLPYCLTAQDGELSLVVLKSLPFLQFPNGD
jgi:hypothetical protein